jgi:hypothetical protein
MKEAGDQTTQRLGRNLTPDAFLRLRVGHGSGTGCRRRLVLRVHGICMSRCASSPLKFKRSGFALGDEE